MRRSVLTTLAVLVLAATVPGSSVWAQTPFDQPTNLQVLDQQMPPQALRATMIGFTTSLGVDCSFCHVAEDPEDPATFDFAADDNPHKLRARDMIKLVEDVNRTLQVNEGDAQVRCMTCHRGYHEPKTLNQVLTDALYRDGLETTLERYHELKASHGGGMAFDFNSDAPLNALGYRLLQSGRVDDAIRVFELNVAEHPEAFNPYDSLAEAYMTKGMRWPAVANYARSLELNPDNANAEAMLERLVGDAFEPTHPPREQ